MNSFEDLEIAALQNMREKLRRESAAALSIKPGQVLQTLDEFITAREMQKRGVRFQVRTKGNQVWASPDFQNFNALAQAEYRRVPEPTPKPEPKWVEISSLQALQILAREERCLEVQFRSDTKHDWSYGILHGASLCRPSPFYAGFGGNDRWFPFCRIDTNKVKLP